MASSKKKPSKQRVGPSRKSYVQNPWIGHTDVADEEAFRETGDFFERSTYITRLNKHTFRAIIDQQDVALVMFYDPSEENCWWAKKHFTLASCHKPRYTHVYAAVNCTTDPEVCIKEDIHSMPSYRMYSRGHTVGTIREFTTFTANTMIKYMESCPILEGPIRPKKPCD